MTGRYKKSNNRRGVALLVVMFLVAMISILSMSYAVKANRQLSCGLNSGYKTEADYLAQTALSYARSCVVNPQNMTTGEDGYWQGDTGVQIIEGNEYFDVTVTQSTTGNTSKCTYSIETSSYKLVDGERMYETNLIAKLRLDPCIAYWSGGAAATGLPGNVEIYGDVYSNYDLVCNGMIYGDVFGTSFMGNRSGQYYSNTSCPVTWPGIQEALLQSDYYLDTSRYFVNDRTGNSALANVTWSSSTDNPKGINYFGNSITLEGTNTIEGTLVVNGDVTIKNGSLNLTAYKNCPAIVATGKIEFGDLANVKIDGLVQAEQAGISTSAGDVSINGGLFVHNSGLVVESGYAGSAVITGDPMKSSIHLMQTLTDENEWSPVGGAYYKAIKRK